jgi:hypothetical protein
MVWNLIVEIVMLAIFSSYTFNNSTFVTSTVTIFIHILEVTAADMEKSQSLNTKPMVEI